MKLTEKQKIFCDEYLIDLNATQAAIRAGYSEKTANRIATENLSKLVIQEYIRERLKSKEVERVASGDEVLEYLTAVMRNDEEETRERIKAAELLGKRYRLFTDKVEVAGKDGGAIETVDRAALEARINELIAKRGAGTS